MIKDEYVMLYTSKETLESRKSDLPLFLFLIALIFTVPEYRAQIQI